MEAVKQDGYALKYIINQTSEICMVALNNKNSYDIYGEVSQVDIFNFIKDDEIKKVCKKINKPSIRKTLNDENILDNKIEQSIKPHTKLYLYFIHIMNTISYKIFEISDPSHEGNAHLYFKNYREMGEWFELDSSQVDEYTNILNMTDTHKEVDIAPFNNYIKITRRRIKY